MKFPLALASTLFISPTLIGAWDPPTPSPSSSPTALSCTKAEIGENCGSDSDCCSGNCGKKPGVWEWECKCPKTSLVGRDLEQPCTKAEWGESCEHNSDCCSDNCAMKWVYEAGRRKWNGEYECKRCPPKVCESNGSDCSSQTDCCSNKCARSYSGWSCYDHQNTYNVDESCWDWVSSSCKSSNEVADKDKDIPSSCLDKKYEVYLHAVNGPHFALGAEAVHHDEANCPSAFAFRAGDGKKSIDMYETKGDVPITAAKIKLGTAKLDDILIAEDVTQAPDIAGYDFEKNSCIHYARNIWRAIRTDDGSGAVKETNKLAEFIIENLVNDNGFIGLVKEKANVGGVRTAAMLALGGKTALKSYLTDLVYGQLDIAEPDEEEPEDAESPIDEAEASIISDVVEACPDQVETVQNCYGGDKEALMTCVNCVWAELLAAEGGPDCEGIDAKVDESVATCTSAGSCNEACASEDVELHSCAVTERCGDEGLVLQIA